MTRHTPVLLNSVLENLNIIPQGLYIDGTVGQAGHTSEILAKGAKVLAIDIDPEQINKIQKTVVNENLTLAVGNYADILAIAQKNGIQQVDGILLDLGLSMEQLVEGKKGFSFKNSDEPLDMRLDDSTELTASDILNRSSMQQLYDTFARYSEEYYSLPLAQAIVRERIQRKFEKVSDLTRMIDTVVYRHPRFKGGKIEQIYARIFQSLRIAVNEEFENIVKGLDGCVKLVKKGGRIVIITFHSGEDRIVKQYARSNGIKTINVRDKKYLRKSYERSAKLRVLEV